ncbi:MAG: hypothetical protein IT562_08760 [Alphaproteobacteria bacterium]|nr:hypothetical protein [Alphaproteobacteria bacterium]
MTMLTAALAMTAMLSLGEAPIPVAYQTAQQAQPAAAKPEGGKPAEAKPAAEKPEAPAPKPAAKAVPKAKPAAKPPAKPAAAKAKAAAKPKTALPNARARMPERRIGEVTVVEVPDAPFVRLDGPWRERGYELRTWLTSYVYRAPDARPALHTLTIQVTHHDEQARNYGTATCPLDPALAIAVATRPNQQCIRNRDGARLCFYTEAYTVTVPQKVLDDARAKGLTLSLGADERQPLAVAVDAATVTAQLRAEEELAKK